MLQSNAYRIADLVSQLETSKAQLRRLRTRALKNHGGSSSRIRKSPKATPKSPRRTRLAPQQTSSPTSILCDFNSPAPTTPTTPNRGHWSVDEEARFDAASLKYGPTAYAQITAAVGSRTEKQVRDRAFRQRQKHCKAAEFAALSIPTVVSTNAMRQVRSTPVTPPVMQKQVGKQQDEEDMALSDCSTSSTPQITLPKTIEPEHPRPTSPLSAVSTVETEFELALLGKTSSTDILDTALFQGCEATTTTSFDWDCPSPVVMESFCDSVSVPEFADNFLLLEHA